MDFTSMIKARKVLYRLFKNDAWLKGRCWGPKRKNNPYSATNITLAIGDELVSISQVPGDTKLRIHEFAKTGDTKLGKKIRKLLKEQKLEFV